METLQSTIFIEFDVNTKRITFLRGDGIIDYDSDVTSVYVRVKYKNLSGNTVYLTPSELKDYKFSLYTIKPATNNVNLIRGEVTDELKENVYGGVIKFEIPRACTNRLGIVKCEIHINQRNKIIASSTFVLDIKQSLVTAFDDELLGDEDFPILKQLILEIQKASNIDDYHRSKITTYSSDKIEDIREDLSLQIKEKASKITTNDIQQQVNNLVLGAVGDGNNAEVIQARGSYSTLNDRHEATENRLENITPTQNIYINGNVKFKGSSKIFERFFNGSTTSDRYWTFQDWVGSIFVKPGQIIKLYLKGYLENVSGKKEQLQYQINWYKEDGVTVSATTTYAGVDFDNIVGIEVPEGDTKLAKVTIYETLTGANGAEFTDKLYVNAFLIYTGDFEFNKEFFPELKKIEETSSMVEEMTHEVTDTKNQLENITLTQNIYIDGDVKFKGFSKVFEISFGGSATNNRYWTFQDWVGSISVQPGQILKLYLKGYLENVSGKKDVLHFQINWYKEDGTTASATTTYQEVNFDNIVTIQVPEGDTKVAKVVIYETLTEANGTEFTDKLHVDTFLLYTGDFEFNKEFFPELKKIEETSNIVKEISHEVTDTKNIVTDIIRTNTNPFSFIQGDAIKNDVDSSAIWIRTDFIPIDFVKAIITCPYGYVVKCLRYGKDKKYLRYGNNPSTVYEFIPAEDEYYFKVVLSLADKTDIVANTFDGSCIKFERYSTNDTKAKVNELPKFGNAMYYQDRITNNKGGYWIWKKDAETNTSHYYCEERIADILSVPGVPTIFITDTHWRTTSPSKFSWDLCGLFADRVHCDNVVMGGDVLTQHATASEGKNQLINEMSNFINRCGTSLKYAFGNHDLNMANVGTLEFTDSYETYRMSYETVYKTCLAHLDGLVNFDYSEIIPTNTEKWYRNRLHYYYDDEKNRIRYIVMDSGTSKDALSEGGTPTRLRYQYNWLAKVLEETPIGYHVMVFAHQFWADKVDAEGNKTILSTAQGDNVSKILNSYQNRQTISGTDGELAYNYDFTQSNGCPIIAMVSGHVHFDYTGAINGIQQIVTTCDAIDHTSHWGVEMTAGTVTEHAFDIIKVDKFTRTVRCFRVGAGEDRTFTY